MPKGTIRRLISDRGFGFIRTAEGADLFFHRSELQGVDYTSLRDGQEVEFELTRGRDGRNQAAKVRIAQPKGQETCVIESAPSPPIAELPPSPPMVQ